MRKFFGMLIAILMVLTFFMLLAGALVSGQNFIGDMVLIIIAIILLAMFSTLNSIEHKITGGKKK